MFNKVIGMISESEYNDLALFLIGIGVGGVGFWFKTKLRWFKKRLRKLFKTGKILGIHIHKEGIYFFLEEQFEIIKKENRVRISYDLNIIDEEEIGFELVVAEQNTYSVKQGNVGDYFNQIQNAAVEKWGHDNPICFSEIVEWASSGAQNARGWSTIDQESMQDPEKTALALVQKIFSKYDQ